MGTSKKLGVSPASTSVIVSVPVAETASSPRLPSLTVPVISPKITDTSSILATFSVNVSAIDAPLPSVAVTVISIEPTFSFKGTPLKVRVAP